MAQTKWGSFAEAWANIAVGFGINFTANLYVLPLFGFNVTPKDAFGIGVIFTVISLARSYVLRRWFNGLRFGNAPDPDDMEHDYRSVFRGAVLLRDGEVNPDFVAWQERSSGNRTP